jgi:hypothetical protein
MVERSTRSRSSYTPAAVIRNAVTPARQSETQARDRALPRFAMASEIMSTPCLHGHAKGEYIVDPLRLKAFHLVEIGLKAKGNERTGARF